MSAFSAIDLSRLPPPEVVETLNYETVLAALKADLITRMQTLDPATDIETILALESEPLTILLEVCAYRETVIRARVNDGARAVLLAFASGADLEHLAALFGVTRAIITPADPLANPPVLEVLEADDRLRQRVQLALEGFTTAGSVGAYTYHALSASPLVKDVAIASATPGTVDVTVLSTAGDGTPSAGLLSTVAAALNAETVRPLCDTVNVQAATIVEYAITAALTLAEGPDSAVVLAAAEASAAAYAAAQHALGQSIYLSAVYAALHVTGVLHVALSAPVADIAIDPDEAPYCTAITVTEAAP